ncbi:MAG: sodium ion-translocating decarboxylase subunit beta [Chloroflexi bacterium]|nr:sodium ion-translocating decarboxylase subunit beta [Chloroflexota bacterium]MBM3174832.1 sodium ion-translocating decarboxylase subunit beta [Chloroflexota bacterium]MBM4450322.1 sodium ion-translocating decarboxylase subunit beta [Chloroflexota bacterium]
MVSHELIGFLNLTWQGLVMLIIGGLLLYLGIARNVEPVLLLPIGIGILLTNIPLSGLTEAGGLFGVLRQAGIETELFPLLVFIGVGSMIDFGSLLARPYTVLLGAAAQFGIFGTFLLAYMVGDGWLRLLPLNLAQAASVGVIGSADGPTSIYVSSILAPELLSPIAVAAYSYMALVPIIQPPIMKLLTTKEERQIRMPIVEKEVSQKMKILFPVVVIIVVGLIAPKATALIGCLMLGNLLKESGVVPGLSAAAENALVNIVTILLGLTVGGMMLATEFLKPQTIIVFVMGIVAFALDTGAGVIFGKIICYLSGKKVNPLIGAAGISAFPMSARVVQKVGLEADPQNHLLMHAAGANTAGQIASVVAGGAILTLLL